MPLTKAENNEDKTKALNPKQTQKRRRNTKKESIEITFQLKNLKLIQNRKVLPPVRSQER